MTCPNRIFPLLAAAALAGCDANNTVVIGPDGREVVNESSEVDVADVQLPPSIVASHAYRCRDNSLVYIDWLSNDTARIKKERGEVGTTVARGEAGSFAGEGQSLTGGPEAQSVTVNGKSCRR